MDNERAPAASTASVAILEDHHLVSTALRVTLESEGFVVIVPALTDRSELIDALRATRPEVALVDLNLGSFGSGEALLPDLLSLGARVIVMSGTADDATAGRCLAAGAWGWIPKTARFERFLSAVTSAAAGQPALPAGERERLLRAWRESREAKRFALEPFDLLTPRETEVLELLCAGLTVDRIALGSFVSEATVRTQVRSILSKLGVHSQLEAVAKANRSGWLRATG